MRTWFVVLLLIACKKDAAPRIDRETLWALVPDNAIAGVVVTPEALRRLESGYTAFRPVAHVPELAGIETEIEKIEKGLKKPLTLDALGLSARESAALFFVDAGEPIIVVPLADRSRFIEISGGASAGTIDTLAKDFQCKVVKDVYACARNVALVDRLGKGRVPDIVSAVGVRGEIEAFLAAPGAPIVGATVQLSRGALAMHVAAKQLPAPLVMMLANARPRIEPTTAGFVMIDFARMAVAFADRIPAVPIAEGVTADALVKSLAGPLTMTIAEGSSMVDVRIPLRDDAPARRILRDCDEVKAFARFDTIPSADGCRFESKAMDLVVDGWVDDKTLRFGDRASAATGTRMTSVGTHPLGSGEWVFSILGRGTIFAPTQLTAIVKSFGIGSDMRALSLLTELGVGVRLDGDLLRGLATVRTLWENPDDVVAKLIAIPPAEIASGTAAARAKAIADAAPTSPFAADYRAGVTSLFIPFAIMGAVQEAASRAVRAYVKW